MVLTFNGISELKDAVGRHWGYSDWHTVTQQQIDAFADATLDHQWIHVDPQRAAQGPFSTTIAHGYLTVSLVPHFLGQIYSLTDVTMSINYGTNKVRFPTLVPVGSRVRGGAEAVALAEAKLGYQLTLNVTVEIEGSDKPACVTEVITVVVP